MNQVDNLQRTATLAAASRGNRSLLKYLVGKGANVNISTSTRALGGMPLPIKFGNRGQLCSED